MVRNILVSLCLAASMLFGQPASASLQLKPEDMQLLDKLKHDMPPVVYSGPLSVANLNLNDQGSVIATLPGEKVFGMLSFSYDAEQLRPSLLHQIIIGFSDMGAQKCIFNEMGYRCGEGITSFFITAPEMPGLYDVLCHFTQSPSSKEAIGQWDLMKETDMMMIGKVLVKESPQEEKGER